MATTYYEIQPNLAALIAQAERLETFYANLNNGQTWLAYLQDRGQQPLPKPPYSSTTNEILSGLLYGGVAVGFETVTVGSGSAVALTAVPAAAMYAVIVAEVDSSDSAQALAIRFRQDGTPPTSTVGHPLGHLGTVKISGRANLTALRAIGVTASKTHKLQVQYFG